MQPLNKKTKISKTPRRKRKSFTQSKNARSGTKVHAFGYDWDSKAERDYYMILKSDKNVKDVQVHPGPYEILAPFEVKCQDCDGSGRQPSEKRPGNTVQCGRCSGNGVKKRKAMTYTPDFLVTYKDGKEEIIDVKGFINESFPLRKKMFEWVTRKELIVIQQEKGGGFKRK